MATTKKSVRAVKEPLEYSILMGMQYSRAGEILTEIFGDTFTLNDITLNDIDNCAELVVAVNEDGTGLDEDETEENVEDLKKARVWAKEVYKRDDVEATLRAYKNAFDMSDSVEDMLEEILEKVEDLHDELVDSE